jgi:hypothetical protein
MAQEGIKECPYLAKYYYDIRFNDLLLMEMYLHGTLAEVGQKFKMA